MKQEINLRKIAINSFVERDSGFDFEENYDSFTQKLILKAMKEACNQCLDLAAENATYNRNVLENLNYVQIDKDSILQIKDWIK